LERERVGVAVTVSANQVNEAVELFSDLMLNSQYNAQQVEAEKEVVQRSQVELSRDQMETTLENAYFTSYRDHQFGQPVRGVRENAYNLSQQDIQDWVANHCVGKNLVVVACGDCSHDAVAESVNQHFGQLAQSSGVELANQDKPLYTPSMIFMRDDEMANMNVGVFFNAPTYTSEDYWAFRLLNNVLGEYNEALHTGANLNSPERQYNKLHALLGQNPDISIHKSFYMPGSDNALFGSYLHGNEVYGAQMCLVSQMVASEYSYHIDQSEVFRARAVCFNELLNQNVGERLNSEIANQVINLGRRVPRSESAMRLSNCAEQTHIQRVCTEWLWDREITAAVWGPLHGVQQMGHYNRTWRRSTLGWNASGTYHVT